MSVVPNGTMSTPKPSIDLKALREAAENLRDEDELTQDLISILVSKARYEFDMLSKSETILPLLDRLERCEKANDILVTFIEQVELFSQWIPERKMAKEALESARAVLGGEK